MVKLIVNYMLTRRKLLVNIYYEREIESLATYQLKLVCTALAALCKENGQGIC